MPGRLDPEPIARRDFLGWSGLWTAGLAIVGSIVGMARLTKPRVLPVISRRFRIGKREELSPGTVRIVSEQNVRISVTDEGVKAMSMVCTHLGCIVDEAPEGFACPCHGSKFDHEGRVVAGPAPRALSWLSVTEAADGSLVVDGNREVSADTTFTS